MLAGEPIAGCGSTAESHAPRVPNYAFQFARCMRANRVPTFPDPSPTGGQAPSDINPASPAYESAQNTCKNYQPPSKPAPPTPDSVRQELLAWAICMRAHGVPTVPDPDANGNIQFPVDDPLLHSPVFKRADNGPCKKYGAPSR